MLIGGDGGEGNDANEDTLFGGLGDDMLRGGMGNDSLSGEGPGIADANADGMDTIWGGAGDDNIYGSGARDSLVGGEGNDTISGGNGGAAETIQGGADIRNNDTLEGGGGNDSLSGGWGDDVLMGGADADTLWGGFHADTLTGGAGADRFVFAAGETSAGVVDTITDFNDRVGDTLPGSPSDDVMHLLGTVGLDLATATVGYTRSGEDDTLNGANDAQIWIKGNNDTRDVQIVIEQGSDEAGVGDDDIVIVLQDYLDSWDLSELTAADFTLV